MIARGNIGRRTLWVTVGMTLLWGLVSVRAGSLIGALYVTTVPPGAQVYVAGELKGVSPCALVDVAIGDVEVKAIMEGYGTGRQTVQVQPDKVTTVGMELAPLANVGNILVLVEPTGSDVEIDRVPFGKTPARIINVEAGTHRLKVSREGYRSFYAHVSVVMGRDVTVRGELVQGGGWLSEPGGGDVEEQRFHDLRPEQVPTPDQMPEAQAFEPVRALLDQRRYDEASALLDQMATQEEMRKYMARITRDRRYIRQIRDVVKVGYDAVAQKAGQEYPLLLRGGISIRGRILAVTDDNLTLDVHGASSGRQIELSRMHVDMVIRLAAASYPPDRPVNQALFAVMYAMEGEFSSGYEALRRAAAGGYNVTDAKSFVDSERLWAAAKEKQHLEEEAAERERELEQQRDSMAGGAEGEAALLVLVDRWHGAQIAKEITGAWEKAGFAVRDVNRTVGADDLTPATVLIIRDPGEGDENRPYEEAELKRIVEFVNCGGGLVFFGSPRLVRKRPRLRGTPFDPLLTGGFQIGVRAGRMTVDDKAPSDYPRYRAAGVPTQRHRITVGVSDVFFDLRAPAVIARPTSIIMATPRFVSSSVTGRGPVPLVAARRYGKGRVVVFCDVPDIWEENTGVKALRMCVNAVRWAAYPKAQAARSPD